MIRLLSPLSLLYSLLSGPVLWFVHFVLVWGVVELGCHVSFSNVQLVSPATIQFFILVTTFVALVAVAGGEVVAYRNWIATQRESNSSWAFEDRHRFLIIDAMILNAFFLVSILATTTPAFFLNVCQMST